MAYPKTDDTANVRTITVGDASKYNPQALRRGKEIRAHNPLNQILSKCEDCDIKERCGKFDESKNARCFFQIQNLKARYAKQDAFISGNPMDLLVDIQTTINKYEECIRYHEEHGELSDKADLKELAYLKFQVFDMLYGRKVPQVANQINVSSSTMDIKELMKQMRKQEADLNGNAGNDIRPNEGDTENSGSEAQEGTLGSSERGGSGSKDKGQAQAGDEDKDSGGSSGDT